MKRIFPIDLSDIGGVESYLSDMAAEDLMHNLHSITYRFIHLRLL